MRDLRTRVSSYAIAIAVTAACVSTASSARADEPTATDRETVRSLLSEGDRLVAERELLRALAAYRGAAAIINVPTTLIEVARTQEALGRLVEARDTYLQVARMPVKPNEPPPFAAARVEATELGAKVAERIPSVTVAVRGAPPGRTPTVIVDGVEIPPAASQLARKVDPGKHAIRVTLERFLPADAEVEVTEGEARVVEIAIEPDPNAPPDQAPPPAIVIAPSNDAYDRATTFIRVGVIAGGAGLLVGSVAGLVSLGRASSARKHCGVDDHCTPEGQPDIDAAIAFANVSNVGFGVALVGAGIAIYGLVTRPSPRAAQAWSVTPSIGPGGAGIRGAF